LKSNFAPKF